MFFQVVGATLKHNLSAESACVGAYIYQVVGGPHDFLIVLYYHDGIAQ